jgi:hypothetical protein
MGAANGRLACLERTADLLRIVVALARSLSTRQSVMCLLRLVKPKGCRTASTVLGRGR